MNQILFLLSQLPVVLDQPVANAAAPGIGTQILNMLLSPSGIATAVSLIFAGLGLVLGTSEVRRRRVALAVHHGFLIAEDIAAETPGQDVVDKIAAALKAADDYALANGWRALKPGEQARAKLEFTSLNGAQKVAEKVAVNAMAAAPEIAKPTAGSDLPKI